MINIGDSVQLTVEVNKDPVGTRLTVFASMQSTRCKHFLVENAIGYIPSPDTISYWTTNYAMIGSIPPQTKVWWVVEEQIMAVPFNSVAEKSCRLCDKKNDIGVTICWCCGNQP